MHQLFAVGFASATEYDIYRAKTADDRAGDVLLGRVTMTGPDTYRDDFDAVGLITVAERDSIWMLVETALEAVEDGNTSITQCGFTFEVDI